MLARPSRSPSNMTPQTVLPMPSRLGSDAIRSLIAAPAESMASPRTSSISSPEWVPSASLSSRTAIAEARSPAAAPPIPSATTSMVGDV